jgi:putative iron-regulated protein
MKIKFITLSLLALTVFSSCKKDEDDEAVVDQGTTVDASTVKQEFLGNYANMVYASYKDSYDEALELKTAIDNFVDEPSSNGLETAKTKWKDAREPYGQTEVYRFSKGPIDNEEGRSPEGSLNAWPLDENYIDYVEGESNSGIVNNAAKYPTIDKAVLASLNEEGGDKNISTGYHAIEFLLWGQDNDSPSAKTKGKRPYTDYVVSKSELGRSLNTSSSQYRRGLYLKAAVDLLLEDLKYLVDEWEDGKENYRKTFIAQDADETIEVIFNAVGEVAKGELATERTYVALANRDQEEEHSCFSDNTHRDLRLNAYGVQNVLKGSYTRPDGSKISGTSLLDIITVVDAQFSTEVETANDKAIAAVNATGVPFDNAVTDVKERNKVFESVNQLRNFTDVLAEAAQKLDYDVNTDFELHE